MGLGYSLYTVFGTSQLASCCSRIPVVLLLQLHEAYFDRFKSFGVYQGTQALVSNDNLFALGFLSFSYCWF